MNEIVLEEKNLAKGAAEAQASSGQAFRPDFSALRLQPHELSSIKHVVAIASGKGGVGKSTLTALTAVGLQREGKRVGILDADLTGPSIPRLFGIAGQALGMQQGLLPVPSATGIDIMSINLILPQETAPVIWRGPLLAQVLKQFWAETIWQDLDYLLIDLPPGTGDVALTIFQAIDLSGMILVTSPQQLVSMIVSKAVNMAEKMQVPILGLVENMSYFRCPDTGKEHKIFGDSHLEEIVSEEKLELLAKMPLDPELVALADAGKIEEASTAEIQYLIAKLLSLDQAPEPNLPNEIS
ncbi:MAG: Mrp/NBP35 family ATP-binding protein [Eubacteriales bacterium]|nr:Mrp/NBP35 family ATP-binding protein [Eubacteriales bacterium]